MVAAAQVGPLVGEQRLTFAVAEAAQHPARHHDPTRRPRQRERLRHRHVQDRQLRVAGQESALAAGPAQMP